VGKTPKQKQVLIYVTS